MTTKEEKAQLDVLNRKKEDAFQKKQAIGTQIAERIGKISDYRKQRNDLTRQVRALKKDRDALNKQITAKISEIKEARPKTKVEPPKDARGRPIRPGALKRQIEQIEIKLETVPMKFDAEQKLGKQLKQIKKQHAELEGAFGLSGELAEKSKEIDGLKKSANELHAKVTVLAKESQAFHEKMLTLSEEIDGLKEKEEEAYQEFLKHKEAYVKIAGDVHAEQAEARKVRKAEKSKAAVERKKKEAADKKTLKERAQEAEEKLSKKKKLTTEDLLALQSVKE